MVNAQQIKSAMKVIDTDGKVVGSVDRVQDDMVALSPDGFTDHLHHFVSLAAIMKIEGDTLIVEPGQATTVEAVEGDLEYAREHSAGVSTSDAIYGTSTASGGSGFGR